MRRRKFKLHIQEDSMCLEDRENIIELHKHIKSLKNLSKNPDKEIRNIIRNEINEVRNKCREDFAHKFYITTISLGPHSKERVFSWYPKSSDILELRDELINELKQKRKYNKQVSSETKEFNGIQYDVVGGVFNKPNSIMNLINSSSYTNRIRRAKRPYDKSNYVGVELELISKLPREKMEQLFIAAKLSGCVYIKHDGSLRIDQLHKWKHGSDTDQHTHEVTLIAKQSNINDVITRVCSVLNSNDVEAYVNNTCGLHVHLDMRNRNPGKCYNNLYQCLSILKGLVPQNRLMNSYCVMNNTNDIHVAISKNPDGSRDSRYQAINAASLSHHKTIEVRLHSGSTNVMKINNWVNLLTKIIDYPEMLTKPFLDPKELGGVIGLDNKLIEYIERRIEKFKGKEIDNKTDNYDMAI